MKDKVSSSPKLSWRTSFWLILAPQPLLNTMARLTLKNIFCILKMQPSCIGMLTGSNAVFSSPLSPEPPSSSSTNSSWEQKDNEHLKEYLQRFNTAALEVPSATQEVKASAFSQGLLDGDFFKSLAKKPVSKFDALLARAAKYINMEDAQAAKKESRREKMKETKEDGPSKKPRTDFQDKKPHF
ncbi:UNVERIFIED_CONTAM: hypothetical protein Slati_2379400 [Sesamum latifolium]|uniref:Uncharacterized protein n=1 Tax=Sesamum latifolium TaxID=2727402 RepID=A0AAW2WB80_9LAMI